MSFAEIGHIEPRNLVMFDAVTASKIGFAPAIVLQRMCWSINYHIKNNDRSYLYDGHWWMKDSAADFVKALGLTAWTVKEALRILKKTGLVICRKLQSYDRTNHYTINKEKLEEMRNPDIEFNRDMVKRNKKSKSIGRNSTNGRKEDNKGDHREDTDQSIGRNSTNGLVENRPIDRSASDQCSNYISTIAQSIDHDTSTRSERAVDIFDDMIEEFDERERQVQEKANEAPKIASVGDRKRALEPRHPKSKKSLRKRFSASLAKTTPEETELAIKWIDHARSEIANFDRRSPYKNWTVEKIAADIGKVKRSTGFDQVFMEKLFEFICSDDFWRKNALSPAMLTSKSRNGKMKIDNIITSWRPDEDRDRARTEAMTEEEWQKIRDENPFHDV